MIAICVDADGPSLQTALSLCRRVPLLREAHGFARPEEALSYTEGHPVDLAVLETVLPGMSGPELARRILRRQPDCALLFLTNDPGHALEAFDVHASGYLLKPAPPDRFAAEAALALSRSRPDRPPLFPVRVQTFGQFGVFAAGQAVVFRRAKAKELLAFLVDRRGGSVTRAEAFAVLWEEVPYDRGVQKQLGVVIRTLRQSLAAYGILPIL